RCGAQERRRLAGARLSRSLHSGREDARGPARRRHAAAEGHAAGARARPQARQPGAARGGGQRNDECLPRAGDRSPRLRHRARGLAPPGRTTVTSNAEKFGAALPKAVKRTAAKMKEANKPAPPKDGPPMYRTNLRNVPKVEGLKRDDGWVDMQV